MLNHEDKQASWIKITLWSISWARQNNVKSWMWRLCTRNSNLRVHSSDAGCGFDIDFPSILPEKNPTCNLAFALIGILKSSHQISSDGNPRVTLLCYVKSIFQKLDQKWQINTWITDFNCNINFKQLEQLTGKSPLERNTVQFGKIKSWRLVSQCKRL
jgi:hypothetical protein